VEIGVLGIFSILKFDFAKPESFKILFYTKSFFTIGNKLG